MKTFRLAACSTGTNCFGLRGCVLVAEDGEVWEIASNSVNMPQQGKDYNVPEPSDDILVKRNQTRREFIAQWFSGCGWELPRRLPQAPTEVVKQLFLNKQ